MNPFENFIEFILNYIVAPIIFIISGIWKLIARFVRDVMKHIYGKILVPIVAVAIFAYIINLLIR